MRLRPEIPDVLLTKHPWLAEPVRDRATRLRRARVVIGYGDGAIASFALRKTYGADYAPYQRPIEKPVTGSVRIAVGGVEASEGVAFTVNETSGIVTFLAGHVPPPGVVVTAGFMFDVPVRFDTDYLEVDLSAFAAGAIPKIPVVEIKP
jgi:uncharacterized protein (TIGR02217 family)